MEQHNHFLGMSIALNLGALISVLNALSHQLLIPISLLYCIIMCTSTKSQNDKRLSFSDRFPTSFFRKPRMQSEYKMNVREISSYRKLSAYNILFSSLFESYMHGILKDPSAIHFLGTSQWPWVEVAAGDKDCVHIVQKPAFFTLSYYYYPLSSLVYQRLRDHHRIVCQEMRKLRVCFFLSRVARRNKWCMCM